MKTTIGILLLLIPFLILFITLYRATGFWDTVFMILGTIGIAAMVVTGITLLTKG